MLALKMRSKTAFFCTLVLKLTCSENEFENAENIFEHSIDENGYGLSCESRNKSIIHTETGKLVKSRDGVIVRAEGIFRYIGEDPNVYLMDYTLDENGYQFETIALSEEDEEVRISSAALASLAGGGLG
ncbi:uncharacterized protein LOC123013157 [Tribolium madens]|uniref:uncharacterized protein LOC123013157 n=1 Tax=Tribolium madens TaxID=41895 RepID=UPI001CF73BA1|nr:uncharacterized protein LOC123013157 [Tribolium madens]